MEGGAKKPFSSGSFSGEELLCVEAPEEQLEDPEEKDPYFLCSISWCSRDTRPGMALIGLLALLLWLPLMASPWEPWLL